MVGWSSRPQLQLVVRSICRGLGGKIDLNYSNSKSNEIYIQPLPTLASVFLARSATTLCFPNDPMFSSLNGFYLRLNNDGGAFKDLASLPGFGALFCSSGSEGKARIERIWAIRLLIDGLQERWDYNCALKRHAPELLMTSFNSKGSDNEEKVLLLRALRKMVEVAPTHMLDYAGYGAWVDCVGVAVGVRVGVGDGGGGGGGGGEVVEGLGLSKRQICELREKET